MEQEEVEQVIVQAFGHGSIPAWLGVAAGLPAAAAAWTSAELASDAASASASVAAFEPAESSNNITLAEFTGFGSS